MSRRRVEACDSWRPPPAPARAPSLLLRAGPGPRGRLFPHCSFASLSVREGGGGLAVKAEEEAAAAVRDEAREKEKEKERTAVVEASTKGKVPPAGQLLRHPLALLALVPNSVALFTAGAAAGAVAKTLTAPLDRVKLLMQARG